MVPKFLYSLNCQILVKIMNGVDQEERSTLALHCMVCLAFMSGQLVFIVNVLENLNLPRVCS